MVITEQLDKYIDLVDKKNETAKSLEFIKGPEDYVKSLQDRLAKTDNDISNARLKLNNLVQNNHLAKEVLEYFLRRI